jgi:hypothetical protein
MVEESFVNQSLGKSEGCLSYLSLLQASTTCQTYTFANIQLRKVDPISKETQRSMLVHWKKMQIKNLLEIEI